MRCAVCRCLRGALRSASSTASTNSTAAFSFQRGRSVFFRGFGSALPMASRTIRRCTPSFWATPAIVPTPNSYSRRICSNNSTLALQSNESPLLRASPDSEYPFVKEVGQNKPPNWAALEYRNQQDRLGDSSLAFAFLKVFHDPWPPPPGVDHALAGICRFQMAEKPPSTDNSTPFTKLESSEARNSATVAISSGRPIFPRGIDRKS